MRANLSQQLRDWWLVRKSGLADSALFQPEFYRESNSGVGKSNPLAHFMADGIRNGYEPNPLFDTEWYGFRVGTRFARSNPLLHYIKEGARAGLDPSPIFDSRWYLESNPEATQYPTPLEHYLTVGALRGSVPNRSFCTVGGRDSVQLRKDVQKAIQELSEQGGSPYYGALHAMAADCCPPLLQQIAKTIKTEFASRSGVAAKPLVSVIMPVHNRPKLVREAIESVLSQSYNNLELIVCDDASDDETPDVVASYRDTRISLIRLRCNAGAAVARNKCLEQARGTYLSYLDSDNIWHPEFLRSMVGSLERSERLVAYASYFDTVFRHGRYSLRATRYRDFDYRLQVYSPFVDLNSIVNHRRLYDSLGGFDESLERLQDYDLIAKYAWGAEVVHVPHALNVYRRMPDQKQITTQYGSNPETWKKVQRKISSYERGEVAFRQT
jgi:hypothetical protein